MAGILMRVGFFTSVEGWGGSEEYLKVLVPACRAAGHDVRVFGIAGTPLHDDLLKIGIPFTPWKRVGKATEGAGAPVRASSGSTAVPKLAWARRFVPPAVRLVLGNLRETRTLRRVFARDPVDVMHVNVNGYEVAGLACRLCGIRTIGMHHVWPAATGGATRRLLTWATVRAYDRVVAPSARCLQAWRNAFRLAESRCVAVAHGVDTRRFAPRPDGPAPSGALRALFVGRLDAVKGIGDLVEALIRLRDLPVTLHVVGDGPLLDRLQAQVARERLQSRVTFAGYVRDVERCYADADCAVIPSLSESFGFACAEAMACGLPVVTSDAGALPEINVDGVTGLVVGAGDAGALADAIRFLAEHPEDRARMGAAGRERVEQRYARERMVADTLRLIETVGRHPAGSGA